MVGATRGGRGENEIEREDDLRSMRSFGGSEVGGRRKKLGSEVGMNSVSTYRMPQVMSSSALGDVGTSMSGGNGYS